MKYLAALIILTISSLCVSAQEIADYKLEVNDFEQLKVSDGVNVEYHCSEDSAGWAYFSCSPQLAERLLFSNNKSQLVIQVDLQEEVLTGLPTIHVYSRSLNKVENSSDSTIVIASCNPVQQFKARIVGNGTLVVNGLEAGSVDAGINTGKGHLVISGSASRVKLSNVGTGPIEAGGLVSTNVKVVLLGTGDIDCCATESISIYGAGSGKVYYAGNPQKIINRSLGIKAFPVGAPEQE